MSTERKVLQPEESRRKGRGQELVGFVHQWGVWSAEVGRHAEGAGGEEGLRGGQSLMTKPSDVHAIPTWSL